MWDGRRSEERRARDQRCRALPLFILVASPAALLVSGCMSGESEMASRSAGAGNHPPLVKAASLLPAPLNLSGPISVRVDAQDLDQQTIVFRYRWFVNDSVLSGQTQGTLSPQVLKRGDHVAVEVVPFDGVVEGEPFRSRPATVVNTPPIISDVAVDIDHAVQGRRLQATVEVADPDHDPVSLSYRWRKNETVVKEGDDATLDLAHVTAKDTIQVEVTASDGTPQGTSTAVERFTLSNSSPSIVSNPTPAPKGDHYEYVVRATDADGDPITYALEVSPPGMTIEAETGHIRWVVTPEHKGSYRVRVVATDSQGGFAAQDFDLSLGPPPKS